MSYLPESTIAILRTPMTLSRRRLVGGATGLAIGAVIELGVTPTDAATPTPEADLDAARRTAASLAEYEIDGDYFSLYGSMHPDSQAVAPPSAMRWWYVSSFLPPGPQPPAINDARQTSWTWGVTGTTYDPTVQVAYHQTFAHGDPVDEVVRLVPWPDATSDRFRWFFGRNQAFIDEQIAAAQNAWFPARTTPAPAETATMTAAEGRALARLPVSIGTGSLEDGSPIRLTDAELSGDERWSLMSRYLVDQDPVILVYAVGPKDMTCAEYIARDVDRMALYAGFGIDGWSVGDGAEDVWAQGWFSGPLPDSRRFMAWFGNERTATVISISARSPGDRQAVIDALATT